MRHRHRAKRLGPSPINGYTSGYGKTTQPHHEKRGLFGRIFGRKSRRQGTDLTDNSNVLPEHTHPADLLDNRDSQYGGAGTGTTAADDTLPPTHNTPAGQPMSDVNAGYGSYGYKPERGANEPAYTHHSEYVRMGTGNTTSNPTPPSAPARYPPGNYRYDDGVYDQSRS